MWKKLPLFVQGCIKLNIMFNCYANVNAICFYNIYNLLYILFADCVCLCVGVYLLEFGKVSKVIKLPYLNKAVGHIRD